MSGSGSALTFAPAGWARGTVGWEWDERKAGTMARMEGRVALVTGGARGIGAAVVRRFVADGAQVVVADVLDAEGKDLVADLGGAAHYVHLDVTDAGAWDAALDEARRTFGPVSVLVNNAGIVEFGGLEATTPERFERVLHVNLVGPFLGMRAALPSLREAGDGVIVNVSSTAGLMGYSGISGYVASKWGLRGLTKATALDLAPDGIRVLSVHPGPIRTPMTSGMGEETVAAQPIPRYGDPEEVAAMIAFVVGEATFSTGSEFVVDGGAVTGQVLALPEQ